ncbi:class I SAM-dependent methyltransferase [Flavicella marina]|uniref:class I SAM-dependent methyltransferase n=1 Tax=Flavicella marina TaxID=1475951 RepID=UPI0012653ABC|nr:class I SAM-dependent methyltransferase [Flavicella marina]
MNKPKKEKTPWPTKDAMVQIYDKHLWGGNAYEFYSGEGSHDLKIVEPYIQAVQNFLSEFDRAITICDLGCGDFNIGRQLMGYAENYIGVDIVPRLIEHNKSRFKEDHLEFLCLDIAKDDLPDGDCVVLRQVLQHLSNREIQAVTQKLSKYKYLIITEHLPNGIFVPNLDIISGQGIRLKKQSGVDLMKAPFDLKFSETKVLCSVDLENNKGSIVTTLFLS